MRMPTKKTEPTAAEILAEVSELRGRVERLEGRGSTSTKDLEHMPTVLVLIEGNTAEVAYSNVPGLIVLVHDKNQSGVLEIKPQHFTKLGSDIRRRVEKLALVELP